MKTFFVFLFLLSVEWDRTRMFLQSVADTHSRPNSLAPLLCFLLVFFYKKTQGYWYNTWTKETSTFANGPFVCILHQANLVLIQTTAQKKFSSGPRTIIYLSWHLYYIYSSMDYKRFGIVNFSAWFLALYHYLCRETFILYQECPKYFTPQ